jgi:hypothetical protein
MEEFSKLIKARVTKNSVLGKQVQAGLVVEFVNEQIQQFWGKKARDLAKARYLKSGMVTITAVNPVMAQELKFKQYKIIDNINTKFGDSTVKKIRIVIKGVDKVDEI